MPEKIKLMFSSAQRHVPHQPELPFQRKHPAAMHHRALQPAVAVVAAHEEIKTVSVNPPLRFHTGQLRPGKGPVRLGMIDPGDYQSIVSTGAAERIRLTRRSQVT